MLSALLLGVVCAACRPASDDGLDAVRITLTRAISNAPLVIADEEGFFADERIRIEQTDTPARGMQSIPLLDRGDIDVLAASLTVGFFAAAASGSQLRLVADRGHVRDVEGCEYNAIIGSKKSFHGANPSAAEVRGKKISVNAAGTAELITEKFVQSRGLQWEDVHQVKLSEMVEAQGIATGAVDLMHASEPYVTRFMEEGHYLIERASSMAPGLHMGVVAYGPRLSKTDPDLGRRFMVAYLRGVRQYAQGATDRNVDILTRRMGFDGALLRKSCWPAVRPDGALSERWLIELQQWGVRKGYLPSVLPLSEVIDMSFARSALARVDSLAGMN
jgi:NitT/TauT family transport system substrate-binding protein